MLLRMVIPLLAVAGTGVGKSPPVWVDAPPTLGGDVLPDEAPPAARGKYFSGDAASGKGAVDVSKSLLGILRI